MTAHTQTDPVRILVVCTGNICRSPFAAQLLRDAIARLGADAADPAWATSVEVTSAGTHAMVGRPMEPAIAVFLDVYGAGPTDHAARQLDAEQVADADLVLALTRDHRRDIVRMLPSASRRVFTLNEFARLLEDAREVGLLELEGAAARAAIADVVETAASRRGFAVMPDHADIDDVVDPYGHDDAVYRASAAHIADIVGRIESAIRAGLRAAG